MTTTTPDLFGEVGADFSACGKYRYFLWRTWEHGKQHLGAVMLNPSKAGASHNDPTIIRLIKRAQGLGYGGLAVVNLYAWISTDPRGLRDAQDPIGPDNERHLLRVAACPVVLLAWGAHADPDRAAAVVALLRAQPRPPRLVHLGLTNEGQPKHPLRIRYTQPLEDYR
ncbi:MAG: DUF1643 domain-containing protein [Elusimicrobia bacterium]|nr:DUF1643 domain-containing protein [Elusimicrobiota bacterium]